MKVPFIDLTREAHFLMDELREETDQVLQSGQYINGPKVKKFEQEFADYCNVDYSVSLGNGSDGLTFIMKALGVGEGDTVICPGNSFIASAWSIVAAGAKPIFCDVNEDMLISVEEIKKVISPSTKAIMAVHLTGKLCEVDEISNFCKEKNIFLIEDSAQAVGAKDKNNNKAGSFGIAASFSLHPLKNLAVYGDGGIVTTNNKSLFEKILLLRNHGLINRDQSKIWGYNSRLDELQAAYALIKLRHLEEFTKRYISIAKLYSENLSNKIIKPKISPTQRDVFHNYVIRVKPSHRNQIMDLLLKKGVETKIHYPIPLHLQECSSSLGHREGDIPNVENYSRSMISLPIYPLLKNEEIEFVIETLNNIIEKIKI
ncbi:DegT/DnrJ/EryC1/StrS family aminotransferase [Prochlorococcus sp. AH-716-M09]|nr:DegT/DnrJ/EryC1/StrS family aminotransferase [Prochlorococcus sp. AH-716-M09]